MPGLKKVQHSLLAFTGRHPLLVYTLFAFALIWFSQFDAAKAVFLTGHIRDTDDAMRLVQVRDLLAGQNWFDLHQYRINPPAGLLMHWSRLIDVPVAALILFFKFFTSTDMAEKFARLVWPALVQFGLFATLLGLTLKLSGQRALFAASILIGFNAILSMQMEPGRIDHHDVLMLLSTLLVLSTIIAFEKPRFALLAGISASAMMAIGFETLPVIAVTGAFTFFYWLYEQRHAEVLLRNFGLSFAAGTLVLYFATTPPALYQTLVCDAQSYASVILALGAGLSCAILAKLGTRLNSIPQKLIAAAVCGAALFAILYIYAKPCFAGPFAALPADLREKWFDQVFEAVGLGQHLKNDFWNNLAFAGPLAVALACVTATFAFQKHDRWRWGLLFALVLAHALLSFEHLRMLPYAILFALPAAAWCVTKLREKSQAGMALLYIISIPTAWAFAVHAFAKPIETKSQCGNPANYAEIAKLPPGRVLAPIDLGTFLLAHTKHVMFGAPYHRNVEGMRYVFATLYETPDKALPLLGEKKIDYVVLCDQLGEQRAIDQQNPESLATRLMKNQSFKGLTKIDVKAPMHVWRVR